MAINKKNTEDYFNSLKKVDQVLNEAADIKPSLSFEDKLKAKLNEFKITQKPLKESKALEEYKNAVKEWEDEDLDDFTDLDLEDFADLDLDMPGNDERNWDDEDDEDEEIWNEEIDNKESSEGEDQGGEGQEDEGWEDEGWEGIGWDDKDWYWENDDQDDTNIDKVIEEAMEVIGEDNPFDNDSLDNETQEKESTPEVEEPETGEEEPETGVEEPETGVEEPEIGEEDILDAQASSPMPVSDMPSNEEPLETAPESAPSVSLSQPQDLDQMIQAMVSTDKEEPVKESTNQLKDLGYEDLKTQGVFKKVSMSESENSKSEVNKQTKLKDLFGEPSIIGQPSKKVVHKGKAKTKAIEDLGYTDLGDLDIDSEEVSNADERVKVSAELKFDKLVEENTQKSKALVQLAEKYINLEDEVKALKLENAKLMKANTILTLLPELHPKTREDIVERFDKCTSLTEVKNLYSTIVSIIKENKKFDINEAISNRTGSVKYAGTSLFEGTPDSNIDKEQARKNFLMGIGNEDEYFNY